MNSNYWNTCIQATKQNSERASFINVQDKSVNVRRHHWQMTFCAINHLDRRISQDRVTFLDPVSPGRSARRQVRMNDHQEKCVIGDGEDDIGMES